MDHDMGIVGAIFKMWFTTDGMSLTTFTAAGFALLLTGWWCCIQYSQQPGPFKSILPNYFILLVKVIPNFICHVHDVINCHPRKLLTISHCQLFSVSYIFPMHFALTVKLSISLFRDNGVLSSQADL